MKKLLGLTLTLFLVVSLFAGCGGGGDGTTSTTPTTSAAATTTKTTTSAAPSTTTISPTVSTTTTTTTSAAPTTTTTTTTTTKATTTTAPATTASGEDALADIFSKAAGITSMYCEVTTSIPDGTSQMMKQWVKGDKFKMEMTSEGETFIVIYNGQDMYMYYPEENFAMKMTAAEGDSYDSAVDETESMGDYSPVLVGSETVDGKDCYVFEYSAEGVTTRTWIWKQYGLPVKMTMTDSSGTTTMLYKNYSFNSIPDAEFELPDGVEIMDMSGMHTFPGM